MVLMMKCKTLSPGCPICPVCPTVSGQCPKVCPRTYLGHMSEVSDVSEDICPVCPALDVRGVSDCPAVSGGVRRVSEGVRRGVPTIFFSLSHTYADIQLSSWPSPWSVPHNISSNISSAAPCRPAAAFAISFKIFCRKIENKDEGAEKNSL